MMHVYPQVGKLLQQVVAHLSGDLWRFVGKVLVAALTLHLKGRSGFQLFGQVLPRPLADGSEIFFAHTRPGIAHHAEHLGNALLRQVQVGGGILGLHIDGGLPGGYGKVSGILQAAADIFQENVLKGFAVQAL
jgi:hypothetical protein